MSDEVWRQIVQVHNNLKSLTLLAEETEIEHRSFLAPVIQQRDALDHIIRVKAAELGIRKDIDADYAKQNLDKALGHIYRAFFDVADWISIRIREKIIEALQSFPTDCIAAVIPDYYRNIRPTLEKICREVADIRGAKDIGNSSKILEVVERYRGIIQELGGMWEQIAVAVPALEDWKQKAGRQARKSIARSVLSSILVAVVGAIVGAMLTWLLVGY